MKMSNTKEQISEKILNHALEIIYLLTGEKYVIVKKKSPHCCIHTQSGEVPIKCDDIAVYFSMEEWDYIKGHKQQYQDVIMETDLLSNTVEITQTFDLDEEEEAEALTPGESTPVEEPRLTQAGCPLRLKEIL